MIRTQQLLEPSKTSKKINSNILPMYPKSAGIKKSNLLKTSYMLLLLLLGSIGVFAAPGATLSSVTISAGTLSPTFSNATYSYTATVTNTNSNSNSSFYVTPTLSSTTGNTIKVNVNGGSYAAVASGVQSGALALNVGDNTINIQTYASGNGSRCP